MMHYDRMRIYGSYGASHPIKKMPRGVPCSISGCEKSARGSGFCITHYARAKKFGNAGSAELMRRAQGEGSITETGYRKICVNGKYDFEHRVVMKVVLGRSLRKGEQIHHKDGDKLNNDPSNLELWSRYQPSGQRITDKVAAAVSLLKKYPEFLAEQGYALVERKDDNVINLSDAVRGILSEAA